MNLDSVLAAFEAMPTDWLILGAFAVFSAFDILRSGARRACTFALAVPIGLVLFLTTENAAVLGGVVEQFSTPVLQAVLLGIMVVAAYILIGRIGLSWGGESGQTIQAALAGVALTAIVATFWLEVPALQSLWNFGPQVQEIFGASYRFWWLLGSYMTLAYIRS